MSPLDPNCELRALDVLWAIPTESAFLDFMETFCPEDEEDELGEDDEN